MEFRIAMQKSKDALKWAEMNPYEKILKDKKEAR